MNKKLKLRKVRVLGLVMVILGIVMCLTAQSWAASDIAVSDSGLYIMAGWGISFAVVSLGLLMVILG